MKNLTKKGWMLFLGISLFLPVVAFAVLQWYNNKVTSLPYYGENYQVASKPPFHTVQRFEFLNQDSALTDSRFTDGKIWVAHFFYTSCPVICPRMMNGMSEISKAYAGNENVRLVSLTVDPYHDTPSLLKDYALAKNIRNQQWQLLTGAKPDLYRYARKALFITATDGDGGPGDFIHSDKLVLVDRANHIRGYYDGTEKSEVQLLINDIKRLLNE